jgi:hypothetical protein
MQQDASHPLKENNTIHDNYFNQTTLALIFLGLHPLHIG